MSTQILNADKNKKFNLHALINKVRSNPKISLIVVTAAAIAILTVLILWVKEAKYSTLFSSLNDKDGGAIVAQLNQMNIPYRFSQQGDTILVPDDKVHEVRLRLAQQGLPKGNSVGFELLDKDKFGISQFSEQINYQRALEGELSRTIETISAVNSARVHLAIPKPSLFVREQKEPSASVTLNLVPGKNLDQGQIDAITHLISSSVSALPPGNVTVIDQNGRLLTYNGEGARNLNGTQLDYTAKIEEQIRRRIEAILTPMLGVGNVHAQVTADIDFSKQEETQELFGPNHLPENTSIRSQQISQSDQLGTLSVGGIPGALSNQPTPPAAAPIEQTLQATAAAQNSQQDGTVAGQNKPLENIYPKNHRRDQVINYELNRTVRHNQQPEGRLKRLSVAVLVNYQKVASSEPVTVTTNAESVDNEENNESTTSVNIDEERYQPVSEELLKKVEMLTREAMGYSDLRGDSLTISNAQFLESEDSMNAYPLWATPHLISLVTDIIRYLILIIVAWILWRKLIRPQWQRYQEKVNQEEPVVVKPLEEETKKAIETARRTIQDAEQHASAMRELVEKDPRIMALIVRHWLSKDLGKE